MVPRRKISAIDVTTPFPTVISTLAQSPYSRLVVYRDSIDNVVGVVRTKDAVGALLGGATDVTLDTLVRPLTSVHESVTADRVLRQLRERRSHQALVVDEFGGTAGLLTLADVLAELLGGVGDEHKPDQPSAETLSDGRTRLPGGMTVDHAAAFLQTTWDTDATTVGGLVTAGLGHLPTPGEMTVIGNYEFEVERVVDRALESVIVRRVAPEATDDV